MKTNYRLEDLGVGALGDVWIHWRPARHPQKRAEYALGSLSMGGFGLIEAQGPDGLVADDTARRRYFGEDWAGSA